MFGPIRKHLRKREHSDKLARSDERDPSLLKPLADVSLVDAASAGLEDQESDNFKADKNSRPFRHFKEQNGKLQGRFSPDGITKNARFNDVLASFTPDYVTHLLPRSTTAYPLHYAVRNFNTPLLESLLKNEEWVKSIDCRGSERRGETPLHVAAEVNNLDALKILLAHGANPLIRQTDYQGLQVVHVAAACAAYEVLKYMVVDLVFYASVAFTQATDLEGGTAVQWAVFSANIRCVRLLLERGCAIDRQSTKGWKSTPVHSACIGGSLEMLKLMANIRPEEFRHALKIKDAEGSTPLHRACILDRGDLVEFLLDHGASPYELDNESRSVIILSAIREAWQSAAICLKWGVDPLVCDRKYQRHVGHHAAMAGSDPTSCPPLIRIIDANPKLRKKLDAEDMFGYTCLQYAAGYGHVATFVGLLQTGADISVRNQKDKTALHYAAKYGQLEIVRTILDRPDGLAILNYFDHRDRTALHLACSYGHFEIVELLLFKGSFPFRNDLGKTPFHVAASKNHKTILESIVTYFALVLNAKDKDGNTALHDAAANDAGEAVRYLLSLDAKITQNADNQTPMDLAVANSNENAAIAFITSPQWKQTVMTPSVKYGNVVLGLISHLPDVMSLCLDRCVTKTYDSAKPDDFQICYDFEVLHPSSDVTVQSNDCWGRATKRQIGPSHTMKLMAVYGRVELLAHPLCTCFLERKWIKYGMYCAGFSMLCNLVFVCLLSYVVITAVETELRPHLLKKSFVNVAYHTSNLTDTSPAFQALYQQAFHPERPRFEDAPSLIIMMIALALIVVKEMAEVRSEGLKYFKTLMNYSQLLMFGSCLAFLVCFYIDFYNHSINDWTFQFAAVAIFLAWFNLFRFCRPFGTFGVYSFMFFSILKTLIQVSFFFFLLTAGFTAAFCTLQQTRVFPNNTEYYAYNPEPDPSVLRTPFSTVYTSALQIGAMTIGDLESHDMFISPFMNGMFEYPVISFMFYAVFLILMPILLNNLLTGLAIGDMAAIQANALSLRLVMQVYLHESLERVLPSRLLNKLRKDMQEYKVHSKAKSHFKSRLARWLQSGGITEPTLPGRIDNDLELADGPSRTAREPPSTEKLHRKLQQLENSFLEQTNMLVQVLQRLDKMTANDDAFAGNGFYTSSLSERARRRGERIEEDRRHAERLNFPQRSRHSVSQVIDE
ncbi:hypothetical protein RvY_02543 [Ramazzottius varieornatus]|uniref:Ion transport domain-containing protein n=1 Tax=Ramazzottius varieornatus TaxID=947166 RepID=A0A1D1UKU8_RAMVA|nr:hypothetical protein RvY_02543 [Ramazzottius varieornatus]